MIRNYIIVAAVLCILIYLAIQVFLSTRPSFIWGLVLPLGFFALAFMGMTDSAPEIMGLTYNATALGNFTRIGWTGCLILLAVFGVCRFVYMSSMQAKRRRLKAAITAKKARQQQAAARQAEKDLRINYDSTRVFR